MRSAEWIRPEWIAIVGLVVAGHRLAVGFYLADGDAGDPWSVVGRVVLGVLAAAVLTGTQLYVAGVLARVDDAGLAWGWLALLVASTGIMSVATLASLYGEPLTVALDPAWLAARLPAVAFAVVLSALIEGALALSRRAASLDVAGVAGGRDWLDDEAEVAAELARARQATAAPPGLAQAPGGCPWCDWTPAPGKDPAQSLRAHKARCPSKP